MARVWSAGGDLLAIDRDHEYRNSVAAAPAGVGAPVVDYRPSDRLLVLGFIDGRTLRNDDVADAAQHPPDRRGLPSAARRPPGSPATSTCSRSSAGTPAWPGQPGCGSRPGTPELVPRVRGRPGRPWRCGPQAPCPCNNDLLAANFIDDGDRIWLIDYEYSGNNDPCFELGNIAAECGLSRDALADLVTAYYGRAAAQQDRPGAAPRPGRQVRMDALGGASSTPPARSTSTSGRWAMERFEAAARGFADAGVRRAAGRPRDEAGPSADGRDGGCRAGRRSSSSAAASSAPASPIT